MKKWIIGIAVIVWIAACKPEIKEIGPRFVPGEGISGKWELSQVMVTDMKLPVPETRDLSSFLSKMDNRLIITINNDGTYIVDQNGKVPHSLGDGGTWMYNKVEFPTMILFVSTDSDSLNANLLSMPRTIDNNFGISFTRAKCEEIHISYDYMFTRK